MSGLNQNPEDHEPWLPSLPGAKELNGRTGRIVAYVEETQR